MLAAAATGGNGRLPGVSHRHDHGGDRRALRVALALIAALMAGEIVAGILAHSLALLSDAAHMLTDAGAIALSLLALRLAARPAGGSLTFGLRRAEVLSAQANGGALLVLAVLILYEAVRRLVTPLDAGGWTMLAVALAGTAVNLVATAQLARANRANMAVEGSYQHVLTDLAAFAATAVAGAVILATGFTRADAIASLVVVALMLRSAYGLLRDSGRVLLEAAPSGMDVERIGLVLAADPRVSSVHDLHVWEIGTDFPALSAHVLVRQGDDCHGVRRDLERLLAERFDLHHTTLQVEHAESTRQQVELGEAVARRTPVER
jgi:cobalt-zinc-cadmium efflux system protein